MRRLLETLIALLIGFNAAHASPPIWNGRLVRETKGKELEDM